jgi:non-specific protein-tyrosine kinase
VEQLDLRGLLKIARQRGWIVILLMLVAGSTAYYRSTQETPVYSTSATMIVNSGVSTDVNEYNAIFETQQLAATFAQLAATGPVLDRVAERLDVPFIESSVSASSSEESQFLFVTVTDTDRDRAVLVANTVVEEFEGYIAERATKRADDVKTGLTAQIQSLNGRIEEIDAQLADLRASANASDQDTQQQITDLTQERANAVQSVQTLNISAVTIDAQVQAGSAQVEVVNPAQVASQISPNPRTSLLLGLFVGLMLGLGVVALLEFLDNTVKPEHNLQHIAGAPTLATVTALNRLQPGGAQVFTLAQPKSSAAEAMRLLRTNLEFASATDAIEALTITSPSPAEGKSTIAANIGVVMAQAGKSVVVVDADLRRPSQHRIFGVQNETGLTTLLTHPEETWQSIAVKVALPGLQLIPSGPIPPNPSDLVGSRRFSMLIERLKREVDMIVIDSPPMLSASDALSIARSTDGVVMVCRSHKTRLDAVRHAAHSVQQGGIRLVGVVLNRQKGQKGAFYYGEYYGAAPSSTPGD